MFLALRQPSVAVFVPVSFSALGVGMAGASVHRVVTEPGLGVAFGALVGIAVALFIFGMLRAIWISASQLVIQGPFSRTVLELESTALGIERSVSSRSIDYDIVAMDGSHRVVVCSVWSRAGAERVRSRFARAFGLDDDAGGLAGPRAPARAALAHTKARQEALHAAAQAQVDAYYQGTRWRNVGIGVLFVVLLYVAAMSYFVFVR